jgi:hypothetical protein
MDRPPLSASESEGACIVCSVAPHTTSATFECGHEEMCLACAARLFSCPLCRTGRCDGQQQPSSEREEDEETDVSSNSESGADSDSDTAGSLVDFIEQDDCSEVSGDSVDFLPSAEGGSDDDDDDESSGDECSDDGSSDDESSDGDDNDNDDGNGGSDGGGHAVATLSDDDDVQMDVSSILPAGTRRTRRPVQRFEPHDEGYMDDDPDD